MTTQISLHIIGYIVADTRNTRGHLILNVDILLDGLSYVYYIESGQVCVKVCVSLLTLNIGPRTQWAYNPSSANPASNDVKLTSHRRETSFLRQVPAGEKPFLKFFLSVCYMLQSATMHITGTFSRIALRSR